MNRTVEIKSSDKPGCAYHVSFIADGTLVASRDYWAMDLAMRLAVHQFIVNGEAP